MRGPFRFYEDRNYETSINRNDAERSALPWPGPFGGVGSRHDFQYPSRSSQPRDASGCANDYSGCTGQSPIDHAAGEHGEPDGNDFKAGAQ